MLEWISEWWLIVVAVVWFVLMIPTDNHYEN
jgi:hypothetical protein